MSQHDIPENGSRGEGLSIDDLIKSAKDDLADSPVPQPEEAFQPSIPVEYADLVTDEELEWEEDAPSGGLPAVLKALLYVICVLTASILLAVFAWKCADDVCAFTDQDKEITVTVPENATMSGITDMLHEKGLIRYKWLFGLYCMVSDAQEKIDPGTYTLNAIFDYHALVNGMIETSENRATVDVTIPEGYELEDIFALLEEKQVCSVDDLENAAAAYHFEYDFLEDLEYGDSRRLEGYLFPDTYEFYLDDKAENVLGKFLKNFDNKITDELKADLNALNERVRTAMEAGGFTEAEIQQNLLTFHDIVIVASLVEKETTRTSENGLIASVIYNRLCSKTYPCLNIDATIQYVLPERKDILTNADKAILSPYNTYTHAGLPVGPIANPGMNAIRAALYPMESDYYFYALDPNTSMLHFSENSYDHQLFLDSLLGQPEEEETEEETPAEGETTEPETTE